MAVKRGPGIPPFANGHAPSSENIQEHWSPPVRRTFTSKETGFGKFPEIGPYAGGIAADPPAQAIKKRFPGAQDVPVA